MSTNICYYCGLSIDKDEFAGEVKTSSKETIRFHFYCYDRNQQILRDRKEMKYGKENSAAEKL